MHTDHSELSWTLNFNKLEDELHSLSGVSKSIMLQSKSARKQTRMRSLEYHARMHALIKKVEKVVRQHLNTNYSC